MKNVKYKIRIKGLKTPAGSIPITALRAICELMVEGAGRALRLSVEGLSLHKGKVPHWQRLATEFTITGIEKGSTVLEVEAPELKEVIPEQIAQQNLWYKGPMPDDTAISVFSRSVLNAVSQKTEGDRYDKGVLDALISLKPVFTEYASDCDIISNERPEEHFSLNFDVLEEFKEIETKTPEPRAIVLSGLFDLIEHSEGRYKLELKDGRKIAGVVDLSLIELEQMRSFWGKQITLKGIGHFTPSGKIRFIEAHLIKPFEEGEEIFQKPQEQEKIPLLFEELRETPRGKSSIMKIWGKWPGDESIEDLLTTLHKVSMGQK